MVKFFKKMLFYKVHLYLILGIAFVMISNLLLEELNALTVHSPRDRVFALTNQYVVYGGLFILWILFVFNNLRSCLYFKHTGRNFYRDSHDFERGYYSLVSYFRDANPYKMDEEKLPIANWKSSEGVILGKKGKRLIHRPSSGEGNFLLIGRPGSHKTTSQIIPTALRFGGSCLVIDIKGDVLRWTKGTRKIKIFNPDNALNSCYYNVFDGISELNISERKIFVENLANVIVQDGSSTTDDGNYFISGGRDYFCGISLFLLHKNIHTTFPEVVEAILHGNAIDWVLDVESGECEEAKEYLLSYKGSNEKNVAGCYNCVAKAVRPYNSGDLKVLLSGNGDCISPQDLENGYDIYLEIPQDKIAIYSPITTIIVQNFMTHFMRRKDQAHGQKLRDIIMLLDEFPQLKFDFQTLSMALSTLRSKAVSIFMAQQSIAQIEGQYGDAHTREIIDNCAYISIMSIQDPTNREWAQRLIGREKVLKKGTSSNTGGTHSSSGQSAQESMEYIYEAADFGYIGKKGDDVIIYANGKYIQAQKTNCFE